MNLRFLLRPWCWIVGHRETTATIVSEHGPIICGDTIRIHRSTRTMTNLSTGEEFPIYEAYIGCERCGGKRSVIE